MRLFGRIVVVCILSSFGSNPADAMIVTWNGLGGGAAPLPWSNSGNWVGGVAPVANDELVFAATTGVRDTTNDFSSGTQFNKITITGGSYFLRGNAVNIGPSGVSYTAGTTTVGTVLLTGTLTQDTTFEVTPTTGTGRLEWQGDITGAFAVNKTGTGMMRYNTSLKTYSGDTNVNQGTLDLAFNAIPQGAGKGNVNVNSGATMSINNVSVGVNGIGDGAGGGGTVSKLGTTARTLTLGNGNANGSFSGNIVMDVAAIGSLSLTKTGNGTQTLGGSGNTWNGATTVNAGTMLMNGTHTPNTVVGATGAANGYTIANGATLGGSGTINVGTGAGTTPNLPNSLGVVVPGSGKIAPGPNTGISVGTLTINAPVSLNVLSQLAYDLTGNNTNNTPGNAFNDLINGVTNLTLAGVLSVSEASAGSFLSANSGDKWRLINYSGSLMNNGLTIGGTMPTLLSGLSFQIDTLTPNQVNLMVVGAAVPEPSAFLFGGVVISMVGMGFRVRRRFGRRG